MNTILMVGMVVTLFGRQDPRIKEAITELTVEIAKTEVQIDYIKDAIRKTEELDNIASGKVTKKRIPALMVEADNLKQELITGAKLEDKVQYLMDTLNVLDAKAKRKNKTAVTALKEKVSYFASVLERARTACVELDGVKAKLEEMQGPQKKRSNEKQVKATSALSEKHGIKIGMTKEQVRAKKGDPERKGFTWWTYPLRTSGGVKAGALRIDFNDKGKVIDLKEIAQ